MKASKLRSLLDERKGEKKQIERSIALYEKENKITNKKVIRYEKAREIVREVGMATQSQLEYHISDITSMALSSIFDDPYELQLEFVQRRNKTECDIYFVRDGNKVDPKSASGGGAVDVAAFALRIASWSMKYPRPNNVIILDEPFKFLSVNHQEQASQMIKQLSKKLNLQFIIITHSPSLAAYADKVFKVTQRRGKSKSKSYEQRESNYA